MRGIIGALVLFGVASMTWGKGGITGNGLRMPLLFDDGMVVMRNEPFCIYGTANALQQVFIEINEQKQRITTGVKNQEPRAIIEINEQKRARRTGDDSAERTETANDDRGKRPKTTSDHRDQQTNSGRARRAEAVGASRPERPLGGRISALRSGKDVCAHGDGGAAEAAIQGDCGRRGVALFGAIEHGVSAFAGC